MLPLTELDTCFPTLHEKNVPVPEALPNNGWWHQASSKVYSEAGTTSIAPTWTAHSQALVADGAMQETANHYPSGGIRPGNNEPSFFNKFVPIMGGSQLAQPYQKPGKFDPQPFSF